ncbi:alpha/beta fold hydrolase [Actinoplanes sp. CA-131856]
MPQDLTAAGTSRSVQTKSWNIHYNEAGTGYPILMLHGSGPGATGWSNFGPNIRVLADSFRVIAPDMPGWGESDAVTGDERDHVEAAVQLLDALDIEKAALVGNSMGGGTALNFAVTHPDRISHLVTMGSGVPGPTLFQPGNGLSEGLKVLIKGYHDPSPETIRELVDIMTYDSEISDELVQQRSDTARSRPDHLANILSSPTIRSTVSADDYARIAVPTLLLHGRDDRVVHFEQSLRLVGLISDARMVLINRCGHWLQLEHADEFNRLVAGFVASA